MLRASALLAVAALASIAACPPAPSARPCNTDHDCFVGELCTNGSCALDTTNADAGFVDAGTPASDAGFVDAGRDAGTATGEGEGEGEGGVGAGEGEGEGEGARDAGVVDAGSDAGVDAGFVDAGPSLCPAFDDTFTTATPPSALFYFSDPSVQLSVGNGAFVVDIGTAASAAGMGVNAALDLSTSVIDGVVTEPMTDPNMQAYVAVTGTQTSYLMMLQFDQVPVWVARVDSGSGPPFDDTTGPLTSPGPYDLRLELTPIGNSSTHVAFVLDDGTGPTVVRAVDVVEDFTQADTHMVIQAFFAPVSNPPPIHVTEYSAFVPCGP